MLWHLATFLILGLFIAQPARAEFLISNAVIEFTADSPHQQDIELIGRGQEGDYIASEVTEVIHPGMPDERRQVLDNPSKAGLLVTPDKTILPAGAHKVLRFVLLKAPDAEEHIYRVAIKPVIKGLNGNGKLGLKILVGYEVLVIVRPTPLQPDYKANRTGKTFTIQNTGNTDILFQAGQQCVNDKCETPPVMRVYPEQTNKVTLPLNTAVQYSVWDGQTTAEKKWD